MIAALSPGLSWLLFGGWLLAVVLIIAFFMGASRGNDRVLSSPEELESLGRAIDAMRYDPALFIRVLPHVYDWQARGDFDR